MRRTFETWFSVVRSERKCSEAIWQFESPRATYSHLLQGYSTEAIAQWLRQRPGLEVVGRDRSHICREGIEAGAPKARQVADRWHLLHSLAQGLEEFLLGKRTLLQKAAALKEKTTTADEATVEDVGAPGPMSPNRARRWQARQEEKAHKCHERLVEQWSNIRRLYSPGRTSGTSAVSSASVPKPSTATRA